MQFTKFNNPAKKRAAARRKQANLKRLPLRRCRNDTKRLGRR